jgi:hypothetical protein
VRGSFQGDRLADGHPRAVVGRNASPWKVTFEHSTRRSGSARGQLAGPRVTRALRAYRPTRSSSTRSASSPTASSTNSPSGSGSSVGRRTGKRRPRSSLRLRVPAPIRCSWALGRVRSGWSMSGASTRPRASSSSESRSSSWCQRRLRRGTGRPGRGLPADVSGRTSAGERPCR